MIAVRFDGIPAATVRRRRQQVRHGRRILLSAGGRPGLSGRFWDDRQAIRLKLVLLALCVIGAGFLEIRW
jgi:hypothetical protein